MLIDYSAGSRIATELGHTVYAKAAWGDAWVAAPNLKCLECAWHAAPQMNTAVLRWDSGAVIMPGDTLPTVFGVWVGRGHFIRVDWACEDGGTLTWVGFVDSSQWPTEAFGSQTIVCYGLEQALAKTPMAHVMWRDEDAGNPVARLSSWPLTFNAADGRRSTAPSDSVDSTIFAFAAEDDEGFPWSTRNIVRYLLRYHLPTNSHGVAAIPWAVDQITQLPDWDAPTVETRNRTVWDVLVDLLSPENQLGFTVGSDGTAVYLRCFTHLANTLTIGTRSLAANPRQHSLAFAPDALTDAEMSDVGGGYDQVIVRGARRATICTLTIGNELVKDWEASLETEYETAASGQAGYAALSDDDKRQRNALYRGNPKLATVFRRFKLDPDWDYLVGGSAIFEGNADPYRVQLIGRLPIQPDLAWDGAVDTTDLDREEGRPALVFWEDPTNTVDFADNAALEQLSALLSGVEMDFTVRPAVYARYIDFVVDGGPQHLIADTDFTKLPVDVDPQLDYATAGITLVIEENRFCEGTYPASPATADIIRRLVIDLGDAYQQVRIHPNTVAAIGDFTGVKKTSDGGMLVDDSGQLAALAQVIAQSVLLTRKTVSWTSLRKIASVAVGDLITTAAGQAVVAPVTAIHIAAGVSVNAPAAPSRQSFEVYRGTMDALSIVKRLGGAEPGATQVLPSTPSPQRRRRRRTIL